MKVRFTCPRCTRTVQLDLDNCATLRCSECDAQWSIPNSTVVANSVRRCLVCPSKELFWRKDFPQRLGLAIVVTGFSISCITWYHYEVFWTFFVLFASALVDIILYVFVGNVLTCYRCHAEYRGTDRTIHSAFDLEVHERYRQQEARMKDQRNEPKSRDDRSRPARLARGRSSL